MSLKNPLDIVRLTPKTNCGQCGYPSCLAFGAAVARAGGNPALCPYLGKGVASQPPSTGAGDIDDLSVEVAREHDLALIKHLQVKISKLDFSGIADRLGVLLSPEVPDTLSFVYLGQSVELRKTGVVIDREQPQDHRDHILLYNYIHSAGGRQPTGIWIGMESMPNSISKIRTLATYCEERLAKAFSGMTPDRLAAVSRRLQGQPGPAELSGSTTFSSVIPVLPMVPLYLLFWDRDMEEGFGARVKILFDHHVLDFLDLESLVFAAERMADRLLDLL